MSLLPDDVQSQLKRFADAVASLRAHADTLTAMLALPPPPTAATQPDSRSPKQHLTHLERAQATLALGQLMHALHQLHMKAGGLDPQKHFEVDMHKENERLAAYKKKVSKAVAAHELANSKPAASLNISATNRFINHAIPDLTPEQRQLLREQSAAGKRKNEELGNQASASASKKARGGGGSGSSVSRGRGGGVGGGGKKQGGGSVKDHAVSFLNAVLQEGLSGKAQAAQQGQQGGEEGGQS